MTIHAFFLAFLKGSVLLFWFVFFLSRSGIIPHYSLFSGLSQDPASWFLKGMFA